MSKTTAKAQKPNKEFVGSTFEPGIVQLTRFTNLVNNETLKIACNNEFVCACCLRHNALKSCTPMSLDKHWKGGALEKKCDKIQFCRCIKDEEPDAVFAHSCSQKKPRIEEDPGSLSETDTARDQSSTKPSGAQDASTKCHPKDEN